MSGQVSVFSLLRQGLAHATFGNNETRGLVLDLIDSIEVADNDNASSVEEDTDVRTAGDSLMAHLADLLGSPISSKKDDVVEEEDDSINDDDDPIER